MDPIRDFEANVEWVVATCQKRVSAYPPALGHSAQAFLGKHGLFKEGSVPSSIAYLLPFWLKETFALDQSTCRMIALGNTFWLLYFFLEDEVMDTGPGEYKGHLLPLGTLFFLDAMAPYRSLLGAASPFWRYLEHYIGEWAESVSWERERHWGQAREFEEGDFVRLARKAAGLKIPCAALSLLAGREEAVAPLEKMVDHVMMIYQLADDLRDWREDLARGNYTYFLTRVMACRGIHPPAAPSETDVEKAIFVGKVLEEVLEVAVEHSRLALESISNLYAPYLTAYVESLYEEWQQWADGWQAKRTQWIREQWAFLVEETGVADK